MTTTTQFEAGDTVVLRDRARYYWAGKIARVTEKHAVIERSGSHEEAYWRSGASAGYRVRRTGSGDDRYLRRVDADELERVQCEFRREALVAKFEYFRGWDKLTIAQLDAVSAIVNGMEPTQTEATR